MEYDPFIKSQLASRIQLWGFMLCKFSHVTFEIRTKEIFEAHRVGAGFTCMRVKVRPPLGRSYSPRTSPTVGP